MKNCLPIHNRIAVVIPCFKVRNYILQVINQIPENVWRIYVIDDLCPENSGNLVATKYNSNAKIQVLFHQQNLGVGAAVMSGYKQALADGAEIIIKLDGDNQMDPTLIPFFIEPILHGNADYTKGNRFFDIENLKGMPRIRIIGNACLSFVSKFSTGYYDIFDPTNGYTAIRASVARYLPFSKISNRYFFETDMLFRLNVLRAVVIDRPMSAKYADEKSNLKIKKIIGEFVYKHICIFFKRIFYNYYLRGMSVASIELPLGLILLTSGVAFGLYYWINTIKTQILTPTGSIMLVVLSVLLGVQFILAFLHYDTASMPKYSQYTKPT